MDKLQLPHAKLLYFVSELWKQHEISDQEKILLKGVVKDDVQNNFGNEKFVNDECDDEQYEDAENSIEDDQLIIPGISSKDMPEEVTSPLGNALFNKKRKQKQPLNVLRDVLRPMSNS